MCGLDLWSRSMVLGEDAEYQSKESLDTTIKWMSGVLDCGVMIDAIEKRIKAVVFVT